MDVLSSFPVNFVFYLTASDANGNALQLLRLIRLIRLLRLLRLLKIGKYFRKVQHEVRARRVARRPSL